MTQTFFDLVSIKQSADLLAIIEGDTAFTGKKNGPRGVEHYGPCPLCGQATRDGFTVQPENRPFPTWFCRKCTGPGDYTAIDYVARKHGLDPHSAQELARIVEIITGSAAPTLDSSAKRTPASREIKPIAKPPAQVWQAAALAYIEYAERQLWSGAGEQARAYLMSERGLTENAIRRFRLGYNPMDLYRPAEKWGTPNSETKDLYLPAGIVIPWIIGGEVWAINTRRRQGKEPKYLKVRGSRAAIFNADDMLMRGQTLFVEGELDAILAWQYIGWQVAVVSMGSGSGRPDPAQWFEHLYRPSQTYILPDNDEQGWKAAGVIAELSRNACFWGLPDAGIKDLGEYRKAGGNVAGWLRENLASFDPAYYRATEIFAGFGEVKITEV